MIRKYRSIIRRKAKRIVSKEISRKSLLRRKAPKRVSSTLTRFPNIGRDIKEYVKGKRVGADQWRRTGVLTFDGNLRTKGPKVTYRRIQYTNTEIFYLFYVRSCPSSHFFLTLPSLSLSFYLYIYICLRLSSPKLYHT